MDPRFAYYSAVPPRLGAQHCLVFIVVKNRDLLRQNCGSTVLRLRCDNPVDSTRAPVLQKLLSCCHITYLRRRTRIIQAIRAYQSRETS